MALLVDSPTKQSSRPGGGVIREARARQHHRRRAAVVVLVATALLGAIVGGILAGSRSRSSPRSGSQRLLAFQRQRARRLSVPAHISPALEGGEYGWALNEPGGGGCCTLPDRAGVGALAGWSETKSEEVASALLSSQVKSIVSAGTHARITTLAWLPYGLRFAHIAFARHARHLFGEGAPALRALDGQGRSIGQLTESGATQTGARWWQAPERPPAGPCKLRARGLAGLQPEWGHVAIAIAPYPQRILGEAFFSCADTEYYLHNWPLESAMLLNAERPGGRPAPIPAMHAITGNANLFEAPGDWHGQITATRIRDAWLLVAGGSGPAQRLQVLRHLTATISLPRT